MNETWHERIQFAVLLCIFLLYPFSLKLCNGAILVLAAHWIVWLIRRPSDFRWRNKVMWLMVSFYLLTAASVLYSDNLSVAIFALDKKISLLIFPVVLGTSPTLTAKRFDQLMTAGCGAVVAAMVFCLAHATWSVLGLGAPPETFFWKELTAPLSEFHPTYLSLCINFFVGWLWLLVFEKRYQLTGKKRLGIVVLIVFFYVCLLLLSSKIQLMIAPAVPLILAIVHLRRERLKFVIPVFILLVLIAALVIRTTRTWERFTHIHTLSYQLDAPTSTFNELTIRLALADCSWMVLKDNMMLGVGVGDTYDALDKVYREVDYKFGFLDQQNPHNEYLSQWLATGVPGLALLLGMLVVFFNHAISTRQYDFFILLLLFTLTFALESFLERQKGIVLFGLLSSLYVFGPYGQRSKKTKA